MTERCVHCNLPIPPPDRVEARIDGKSLAFCCRGCLNAYRILTGAGLGAFYEQRTWAEPGVPEGAFDTAYDPGYLERFVRPSPGGAAVDVLVDGIRCASCVWVLERWVGALPGVREVRVNFATHRARVVFDPEAVTPAAVFTRIAQIGYRPRPFSPSEAEARAARERRGLLVRFGTAAFFSMQLMVYALGLYAGYFHGMGPGLRRWLQLLTGVVATPVVFYAGWPFLAGAGRSLRNRAPDMDLLVGLGVGCAYGYSWFAWATGRETYFESAAMVVTLLLLGRLVEAGARRAASAGIDRLLRLAPETALRLEGDTTVAVDPGALAPGDRVWVRAGDRFPADGVVVEGATEVDESAATGEPVPVGRGPGDPVLAGTTNLGAGVTVEVTTRAADSFVGRVARLVEEAQARRAPIQALADRVAGRFVPFVLLLAAVTFGFWAAAGRPVGTALLRAVAVLVVACPCALGLATPVALVVAAGAGARRGILFRGGDVLEALGRARRVALDKTGTLTLGRPRVERVEGPRPERALAVAAALEHGASHPLAAAVLEEARRRGVEAAARPGVRAHPGLGVEASGPPEALAGSRRFLEDRGVTVPPGPDDGALEIHVAEGGTYLGRIRLSDPLRPDAPAAVAALAGLGLRPALLTGDRERAAREVARRVGIREVHARLSPEDKAMWVRGRQAAGEPVLMVGDGINDAPALAAAAVGCALAGGTDVALDTSDLVLTRPDLLRLAEAVGLARRTLAVVRQNLGWAFGYNLVALPLAASGRLAPVWAAAAMAASSVAVLANSLRLARAGRPLGGTQP